MPDHLDQQFRQLKDADLLREDPTGEREKLIEKLERRLQEKYAHTKKDKWHRVRESQ